MGAEVRRNVNRRWDELRKRAGLDQLRLHDLRHGCATFLQIGGVTSDATFPGRRERAWPALRCWNPRGGETRAGGKVAGDLRWHYPVASARTMMHPDLLHPAAA